MNVNKCLFIRCFPYTLLLLLGVPVNYALRLIITLFQEVFMDCGYKHNVSKCSCNSGKYFLTDICSLSY